MIHQVVWIFSHDSGSRNRRESFNLSTSSPWDLKDVKEIAKEERENWSLVCFGTLTFVSPCFGSMFLYFMLSYLTNYIKTKDLNCLDLSYLDCFFCHGVPDVACDHVFLRSFFFPGKNMSWAAGGRVTEPICCRRRCHTEDFHGTLLADSNLCGSLSGWMKARGPQGILKKVTFHQRARRLRDSA